MRVYISGPITGRDKDETKQRFTKAAMYIIFNYGPDTEIINPAIIGDAVSSEANPTHEEFMKISFALMDICNAVFFMPGWEDSDGCRQEWIYAHNTMMRVLS